MENDMATNDHILEIVTRLTDLEHALSKLNNEGYTAAEGSDYPTDAELRKADQVFNRPADTSPIDVSTDGLNVNDWEFDIDVTGGSKSMDFNIDVDGETIPVSITVEASGSTVQVMKDVKCEHAYTSLSYEAVRGMSIPELRKLQQWVNHSLALK